MSFFVDAWQSIAPSGLTLWLFALVAATVIGALTLGRLFRYGPARTLFLAPAFLLFSVFVLYPIVGSTWMSLHDVRADRLVCSDGREIKELEEGEYCRRVQKMEWVGLDNYRRFFAKTDRNIERAGKELAKLNPVKFTEDGVGWDPSTMSKGRYPRLTDAGEALLNNLIWLIMFQVAIPIGLALAVLLNQNHFVVRLMKPTFFFPFVLSPTVIAFLFQFFYNTADGAPLMWLFNSIGWGKDGILGTDGWSNIGIIIAAWYPQIAYCVIIYLAGLTAINAELIEAGKLDGAAGFTLFRKIVLPQLWPATFICVVVTTIGALRSFDLVHVMTVGGQKSEVLARLMYEVGFGENGGNYGYGATISVILFLIMLVFIIFFVTNMVRQADD